jgi:hypothetical protein
VRSFTLLSQVSNIPTHEHYAIITFASVFIPGDERSRTNPGHGYPASTETYNHYYIYESRADWEAEVSKMTLNKEKFLAIHAKPASVSVETKVKISSSL